jgi:hypothetical protein
MLEYHHEAIFRFCKKHLSFFFCMDIYFLSDNSMHATYLICQPAWLRNIFIGKVFTLIIDKETSYFSKTYKEYINAKIRMRMDEKLTINLANHANDCLMLASLIYLTN